MSDRNAPLPSTWIARDLYTGPTQTQPGVLKLDANEGNPPPRKLLKDLATADLSKLSEYPDARPLESEIADRLGVDPDRVVVTAGADEALDRLFRAYLARGRRVVLPVPAFEMMYRYADMIGGRSTRYHGRTPSQPTTSSTPWTTLSHSL